MAKLVVRNKMSIFYAKQVTITINIEEHQERNAQKEKALLMVKIPVANCWYSEIDMML